MVSIQNQPCHIAKTPLWLQGDSLKPQKETLLQQCGFNVDDRRFMPLETEKKAVKSGGNFWKIGIKKKVGGDLPYGTLR